MNDYKLLACDIQQLLVAVAIHACSSSGSQYFRVIEDLIVLLGHLQNSKNARMQSKLSVYFGGHGTGEVKPFPSDFCLMFLLREKGKFSGDGYFSSK